MRVRAAPACQAKAAPCHVARARIPHAACDLPLAPAQRGSGRYPRCAAVGTQHSCPPAATSAHRAVSVITSNSTGQVVAVLPTNYSSPLVTGPAPSPADLAPARGLIGPVPAGTTPPFAGAVAFTRHELP